MGPLQIYTTLQGWLWWDFQPCGEACDHPFSSLFGSFSRLAGTSAGCQECLPERWLRRCIAASTLDLLILLSLIRYVASTSPSMDLSKCLGPGTIPRHIFGLLDLLRPNQILCCFLITRLKDGLLAAICWRYCSCNIQQRVIAAHYLCLAAGAPWRIRASFIIF